MIQACNWTKDIFSQNIFWKCSIITALGRDWKNRCQPPAATTNTTLDNMFGKIFYHQKACPGWGSNSRPSDYETDALPTALPRLTNSFLQNIIHRDLENILVKNHVTHGGTRTPNLRFRRPTPYPLGHAGNLYSMSIIHLELEMAGSWRQKVWTVIVQRIFSELSLSARLAQSVEHETLNLRVVGSSPTLGVNFWKIFWEDWLVDLTILSHTCYTGAVA